MKKMNFILLLFLIPIMILGQETNVGDTAKVSKTFLTSQDSLLRVLPIVPGIDSSSQVNLKIREILDNKFIISCGSMFGAGIADAVMQVLHNSYGNFKQKFPHANDNYWNWEISYKNKYKNNDPTQGPKYPGSTTIFAGATDGWHTAQFGRNVLMATTLAINLIPSKKVYYYNSKWYVIAGKALAQWAFFNAGKEITFKFFNYK